MNEEQTTRGPGHNSVLKLNGRHYIVYHQPNQPHEGGALVFRQTCADLMEFHPDGTLKPVTPTQTGVGSLQKPAPPRTDLARGRYATATSVQSGSYVPEYALDHNHASLWRAADNTYPIEQDLQWMLGTVYFYDSFYRAETKKRSDKELGDDGRLVLYPGNGLEYAGDATSPLDGVSGLLALTEGLLRCSRPPAADRQRLERILETLPPLPTAKRQGRLSLLPAKTYRVPYNKWEPIEMYACWPYRLVGITRPDTLPLARDTWETVPPDRAKLCRQDFSWMANVANMAALAWPEKAKQRAIYKMANVAAPQARFPAFFGPGHDWLPDHNWGGAGMTGLQESQGNTNEFQVFPPGSR